MPRAVLWDLDGTLADSREAHWRSWCEALAAQGIRITKNDFLSTFGQRNDAILEQWIGPDITAEFIRAIGDAKEESYRAIIKAEGLTPLPGAAEWVRALHAEGWRQAIASSAPRLNVEVMRGALGLAQLIETYVGAEDVKRGKPDPEVFLAAADALEVPAKRCIVVEDAEVGVEAAHRAGMRCIGVGDGSLDQAEVTVNSLADLREWAFRDLLS
jgi:HAD superfamily hydrolase (TIGR01509 family)